MMKAMHLFAAGMGVHIEAPSLTGVTKSEKPTTGHTFARYLRSVHLPFAAGRAELIRHAHQDAGLAALLTRDVAVSM